MNRRNVLKGKLLATITKRHAAQNPARGNYPCSKQPPAMTWQAMPPLTASKSNPAVRNVPPTPQRFWSIRSKPIFATWSTIGRTYRRRSARRFSKSSGLPPASKGASHRSPSCRGAVRAFVSRFVSQCRRRPLAGPSSHPVPLALWK